MRKPPFAADDSIFQVQSPNSSSLPPDEVQTARASLQSTSPSAGAKTPDPTTTALAPNHDLDLILPAAFVDDGRNLVVIGNPGTDSFRHFVKDDLDVSRLNAIHKHLWLAGLPVNPRALHYQRLVGRSIIVTQRADLHLVWQDSDVFLKPLPPYLLDWRIWNDVLLPIPELFEAANGILLTYLWMIRTPIDLTIAHANGLIPSEVTWERWSSFSRAVLSNTHHRATSDINPRYIYGELRLSRLNSIYRYTLGLKDLTIFMRCYHYGYRSYSSFIERNFAWLVTAIVYITVVLTAMAVGLVTPQLRDNAMFNRVSYGFTIFSIIAPLVVLLSAAFVSLVLVVFNVQYALSKRTSGRGTQE